MRDTRTDSDLAEALATLERYTPDPDTVLRGLPGRPRSTGARWRSPAARWRRPLFLSAAALAAAAVLAVALLRPAQPRLPSAKSVATAMLTAFDSVRGDVEYETQTGYDHGVLVDVYRSWTWPAQPVAGQRQLSRTRYSGTSPASATVKLTEDRGTVVVNPPDITGVARGQVTMVCFAGTGQTGCGYGERNTLPGTWSRFTAPVPGGSDVGPGGFFNPSLLARGLAAGAWRVVGRARVDGQPAIELKENGNRKGIPESLPGRLWVNAQTYLPIRLVFGGSSVQDFRYLPPTPANLALLQVPIPPGYPRR
jgi:hypothetical protein